MVSATFLKPNFPNFVFNPKTKYLKKYYANTFGSFVKEKKISKKISKTDFKIPPLSTSPLFKIEMYLYMISKSASSRNQRGKTISVRSCVTKTKPRFPSSCFLWSWTWGTVSEGLIFIGYIVPGNTIFYNLFET